MFKIFSLTAMLIFVLGLMPFNARAKELRYANFPPAGTIPSIQMDNWIEQVEKISDGQLEFQTFPASTLLDVKTMLRGVAQGQADIGCTSLLYYPNSFPLFEVFGLPLGFSTSAEASFVAFEIYKKYKPKELARYKVLSIFTSAPSQVMSKKPVNNIEELQKIILRSSGPISDALEVIGGKAVSIPMSETPEALQKGIVDGVCSSWDTLYDMNYAKSCQFGLTIDMPVYPFAVIMNKKSWENLPEDLRKKIDDYADTHVKLTGEFIDMAGKKALDWAIAEHNFQLVDSSEKTEIIKASMPLMERWKEKAKQKGLDPDAILVDIQNFKKIYQESIL